MRQTFNHKRWVWTELLGFNASWEDCGVQDYLQTLGFVPDGVSLLISTPDFILQHEGLERDAVLPPDVCSRNGQEGNELRSRQDWTRFQLKRLVAGLRDEGCEVYFSSFTSYLNNRFHHEWMSDHPEAKVVSAPEGKRDAVFPLARLADGMYFQDYFARQLAKVCADYGFDGWHGSDGYGPQWVIFKFGCGDDFVGQFVERGQHDLPEFVVAPCEDQPDALQRRMDWIWRHRRQEWIEFYSDRWAEFWQAVMNALHAIGRKAMINSAWTKDPFEAKYRYGVDYRKIAATGVDAMMVETAAGGILLGTNDRDYHYDFLAMLMFIRACVPNLELIFLHGVKDVEEDWDLLRHAPTMLERETYALANVYHADRSGKIGRCADGFMACLADGVSSDEWKWLADRWTLAFGELPQKVMGATLLWSDSMLDRQLADFPIERKASAHYLTYKLMEHNAPIQLVARFDAIEKIDGPFLLPNPHLLSDEEKARALDSNRGLILIGPDFSGWPEPAFEYLEGNGMGLRLYGLDFPESAFAMEPAQSSIPDDPLDIKEPSLYRAELLYRPIFFGFFEACARIIQQISGTYSVESQRPANLTLIPPLRIGIMMTELKEGTLRLVVKNSAPIYGRPSIDLGRPIKEIKVRSTFPVSKVKTSGSKFNLVVPPMGVVVLDITTNLQTSESNP